MINHYHLSYILNQQTQSKLDLSVYFVRYGPLHFVLYIIMTIFIQDNPVGVINTVIKRGQVIKMHKGKYKSLKGKIEENCARPIYKRYIYIKQIKFIN